ncbi:hypothetical protein KI387_017697, partial [Taxus chinensis]
GILSEEEISDLEKEFMAFIRREVPVEGKDFCDMSADYSKAIDDFSIINIMLPSRYKPSLKNNIYERRATSISKQLLGPDMCFDYDQLLAKPPNKPDAIFHWHQDLGYWPVTKDTRTASFWLAIDNSTVENGCLHFVPGSHLEPELRNHGTLHGDRNKSHTLSAALSEKDTPKPAELARGDATVHHERILHGSGSQSNKTSRKCIGTWDGCVEDPKYIEGLAYRTFQSFRHHHKCRAFFSFRHHHKCRAFFSFRHSQRIGFLGFPDILASVGLFHSSDISSRSGFSQCSTSPDLRNFLPSTSFMLDPGPSQEKTEKSGRMKYKFKKVESSSYIDCNYDIRDTELGNIDIEDFWSRVRSSSQTPWMKSIADSGLPLAAGFPMSAQCPEFILACASSYDSASHSVKSQAGEVVIKLDGGYFDDLLRLPNFEEYGDLDIKSAQKAWDND